MLRADGRHPEALDPRVQAQRHHRPRRRADLLGVLALFPAVLVLVSILGLLGKSTTQQVLANLGQVAPGGVHTS